MRSITSEDWYNTASRYARFGWQVVPMHGIPGEGSRKPSHVCTCQDEDCASPGKHPWTDMWEFIATDSLEDLERYSTFQEACGIGIVIGAKSGLAALIAEDRDAATYVRHHTRRLGGALDTVHFESDDGF